VAGRVVGVTRDGLVVADGETFPELLSSITEIVQNALQNILKILKKILF